MLYVAHRINTIDQLNEVPQEHGVEIDLRDRGDRLILQHDPFRDGVDFEHWLAHYRHALMILNIKSERSEHRAIELIRSRGITSYFLLDCSFPMIRLLNQQGERRIAVRFSECEPLEGTLALAGKVDWAWIDCFSRMPLDPRSYKLLKSAFKLCAVSPELQGRPVETIADYAEQLRPYPLDAICTKRPDLWRSAMAAMKAPAVGEAHTAANTRVA